MTTIDVLCPGERLVWVSGMVERSPQWYTVAYSYTDRRGIEYFSRRKFMDMRDARAWMHEAARAIHSDVYTH